MTDESQDERAGSQDTARWTRSVFEDCGSIVRGHFRVPAGHHSEEFWDKSAVLQRPSASDRLFRALANRVRHLDPDVIAGPAKGGMIVAWAVARHLGCDAAFLERQGTTGAFALSRGQPVAPRSRAVLVDDILSSGHTLRLAMLALEPLRPVGIGVIVDRSGALPAEQCAPIPPVLSLISVRAPAVWPPEECPLCAVGMPLVDARTMTRATH